MTSFVFYWFQIKILLDETDSLCLLYRNMKLKKVVDMVARENPDWCNPSDVLLFPGRLCNFSLLQLVYLEAFHAASQGIVPVIDWVKEEAVLKICWAAMERSSMNKGRGLYNKDDITSLCKLSELIDKSPLYPLCFKYHLEKIDLGYIEAKCYESREATAFSELTLEEQQFVVSDPVVPTSLQSIVIQSKGKGYFHRMQAGYFESVHVAYQNFALHAAGFMAETSAPLLFCKTDILSEIKNEVLQKAGMTGYQHVLNHLLKQISPRVKDNAVIPLEQRAIQSLLTSLPPSTASLDGPTEEFPLSSVMNCKITEALQQNNSQNHGIEYKKFDRVIAYTKLFQRPPGKAYEAIFPRDIPTKKTSSMVKKCYRYFRVIDRMECFYRMNDFDFKMALDEFEGRELGSQLILTTKRKFAYKSNSPKDKRPPYYVPTESRKKIGVSHICDARPNYFVD
jgi:hypothetical protein